jgi:hypothetical protein
MGWVVRVSHEMLLAQVKVLAEAIDNGVDVSYHKRAGHRSGEGDPFRLRGIPCVAKGVSGAHPGSVPHVDGIPSEGSQ